MTTENKKLLESAKVYDKVIIDFYNKIELRQTAYDVMCKNCLVKSKCLNKTKIIKGDYTKANTHYFIWINNPCGRVIREAKILEKMGMIEYIDTGAWWHYKDILFLYTYDPLGKFFERKIYIHRTITSVNKSRK